MSTQPTTLLEPFKLETVSNKLNYIVYDSNPAFASWNILPPPSVTNAAVTYTTTSKALGS